MILYDIQRQFFSYIWYIVVVYYRKDMTYIMKFSKILKNLVIDTSIFFTVITAIYSAIMLIIDVGSGEPAMKASWLLYIFLFSLLAAISQCIYRITSLHKALRVVIQYAILLFASYICLFAPLNMAGGQVLIGFFLVSIIYFVCYGIGAFFIWRFNRMTKKEEVYEEKFKKRK